MSKYYKILYYINQNGIKSQRELAAGTDLSLGHVNTLMKEMVEQGYLDQTKSGSKKSYEMTEVGKNYLENCVEQTQEEKLFLNNDRVDVDTAVILAAGANKNFDCPVGLLPIDGIAVIDHCIRMLGEYGVTKIYVVVGSQKDAYRKHFENRDVTLVENNRYKWSGTMASLAAVKNYIESDFLLIDGNQIFEEAAIHTVLKANYRNCVLLTSPSGSKDEAYVELDKDGSLFRISKDIRQMNHIDAEMVGFCKISYSLYRKMLEIYEDNSNPLVGYEYVLEDIGRIYRIHGCHTDDLVWCIIENAELYHKASSIIYPKMKKKMILAKENRAKETLKECMNIQDADIEDFRISGGMTNTNFYVKVSGREYILRIPGACTEQMVSRKSEQHNSALASAMGFNPNNIYFDPHTGVKITDYVRGAETLRGKTARMEVNMAKTTSLLRRLHHSDMKMYGEFSLLQEYEKYKTMMAEIHLSGYDGWEEADELFYQLMSRMDELGWEKKSCHNDLVPENFILDEQGRLFLIDWEYSGYNDPMWDIASHLIECEFDPDEEELFLQYYFQTEAEDIQMEKILIFKICQDILWSLWTRLKEAKGEDFGTYGTDRLARALQLKKEYGNKYGK